MPLRVDGANAAHSGPAIVVLWATWCASCIGELKRLPALAAAARPLPVVTLAIDPPQRARRAMEQAGLDTRNAFADPGEPAAVLAKWGGTALPLAVAIDAHGKVCGRKRGLLGSDQMKQWAKACLS
ncbi:TlpA disulfide reductase family protein [Sphingomonas sp. H39-1-10]|uniref:TlpA family protein disulfide reductase n=1 Tax=Sphingomonas pollutisoli TaxID=3030829 RepID=UPI0023B96583|nr:TlpA disulfide reductase family protein [Sphingomonas pollutisoli]MDF0490337.1 TlpA disulfide reductase family protein [Sphingomonas pollutisoli]